MENIKPLVTPSCFVHVARAYKIIFSLSHLAWVPLSAVMRGIFLIFPCILWKLQVRCLQIPSVAINFSLNSVFKSLKLYYILRSTFDTYKFKGYQTLFLMTARVIAMICNKTDREVQICLLTSLYRTIFPEDRSFDGWIGNGGQFFSRINTYREILSQLEWCISAQNAIKSDHLPWD